MRLGLSLCRTAAVIQGKASLKLPGTVFIFGENILRSFLSEDLR